MHRRPIHVQGRGAGAPLWLDTIEGIGVADGAGRAIEGPAIDAAMHADGATIAPILPPF